MVNKRNGSSQRVEGGRKYGHHHRLENEREKPGPRPRSASSHGTYFFNPSILISPFALVLLVELPGPYWFEGGLKPTHFEKNLSGSLKND